MNLEKQFTQETHPLFPSGEWEGFYTYQFGHSAKQYQMSFTINFEQNIVFGKGSDDIGYFDWKGKYDKKMSRCEIIKHYNSHTVFYKGNVDENGIWGIWFLPMLKGGFHIWPKSKNGKKQKKEVIKKSTNNGLTFLKNLILKLLFEKNN